MAADPIVNDNNKGWQCPVCHRGVAPGVATCDHGANAPVVVPPTPSPVIDPWWNRRTGDPFGWPGTGDYPLPLGGGCQACAHSGLCMCVRYGSGPRC